MKTKRRIKIGELAGHHFHGRGDLEVVHHCTCGDRIGYRHVRKRLVDRAAFNYDTRMGWEVDVWFEWKN